MNTEPVKLTSLLGPRYWLGWLGFGLIRIAILLPFSTQVSLGKILGRLLYAIAKKRVQIARCNITHCLPELSKAQQQQLVLEHFESIGIAFFETAWCWWQSPRKLKRLINEVKGLEHVENAKRQDKGIILLSAHFTTLDIGGRLLLQNNQSSFAPVYRRMNSPLQEYFTQRGRSKGTDGAIPHTNLKKIIRHLRGGGTIWYASDQQHQGRNSAIVDFFGQPSHSATATSDIARLGNAVVIPFWTRREANGYALELQPPLDNFPSGDAVADTEHYHRLIEEQVYKVPEQYLWVHRRFKGLYSY